MGGLIKILPFTYTTMLIGSLSLLATPWLTAYFSKDLIIELAYAQYSFSGTYVFILGTVTAGLTAFYSVRLLSLVFFTVPNGFRVNYENAHEANLAVVIPFIILGLFSIGFGYLGSDLFTGVGSDFFGNSLFIHPNNVSIIEAEFAINPFIKLLPLFCTILGASSAFILYNFVPSVFINITETSIGRKIYSFLNGKYYFDVIYNNFFIATGLQLGFFIAKVLDRGIIEFIGPFGLSNYLIKTSFNISKLDSGLVTNYALYITLGLLSLLFIIFYPLLVPVAEQINYWSEINGNNLNFFFEIRLFIIYIAALIFVF